MSTTTQEKRQGKRLRWADTVRRAERIKELRATGLKQQAIASELGISRDLVAYYMSKNCKASVLATSL